MWHTYYQPTTLSEALALLSQHGDQARVIAGGTDLIIELERGVRRQRILVDITRIPGLDRIELDEAQGEITLGPLVTHNDVVASPLLVERAFPLAQACWEVGAPQIRNRGTVAGNLITASPANDTITPLWALDAAVTLTSQARGSRRLTFDQFFLGVRRTALQPDELLTGIHLRALPAHARGAFIKLGLRRVQAISLVNAAVVVEFAEPPHLPQRSSRGNGTIWEELPVVCARIALGAVAPTIVRAEAAEASLVGRALTDEAIAEASRLAMEAARPIDDVRASADYRRDMVRVLVARALRLVREGNERANWPDRPVLLRSPVADHPSPTTEPWPPVADHGSSVTLRLNGRTVTLEHAAGKTLLRALREDGHMTGVKEGCAEGECGACTVWLDGQAVMACLVPAERAAGCDVVTVEGLARNGDLHPIQSAFIAEGAVQCGYCTPGLVMSGAMLLQERPDPTFSDIQQALAGNLCRCTGYAKVIAAVEKASKQAR
ncbi:MAG: FAD binding domain-containing protein [Anaerolineae bacterium]|nr:FAD binding domain-containing protein [Anaerolineae bacterium]